MGPEQAASGAAWIADLITVGKNLVSAVNGFATARQQIAGTTNAAALSTGTVVKAAAGRVVTVSVTTAGSATGLIYDTNLTTVTTRPIYVIPTSVGVVSVNLFCQYGIYVVPGTGQVVTVGYS